MGLADHINEQRSAREVTISLAEGSEWRVRLRPISPAQLVMSGGELWNVFSEGEIVRALTDAQPDPQDREAGTLRALAALTDLQAKAIARKATESPAVARDRHSRVREQAVVAVCAAVEAIDTQDGDGKGFEPVELVAHAKQAKGGTQLWVGDLPGQFVGAVFPHVKRISTDGSAEVAAVVARFRGDAEGAGSAGDIGAAADAGAGGPIAAVDVAGDGDGD